MISKLFKNKKEIKYSSFEINEDYLINNKIDSNSVFNFLIQDINKSINKIYKTKPYKIEYKATKSIIVEIKDLDKITEKTKMKNIFLSSDNLQIKLLEDCIDSIFGNKNGMLKPSLCDYEEKIQEFIEGWLYQQEKMIKMGNAISKKSIIKKPHKI